MGMPMYNGKYDGLKPGMYLGLFHGFKSHEERAAKQDWGSQGPLIGPLVYAHTTYASEVKLKFTDPSDATKYGLKYGLENDGHLVTDEEDCIVFEDMQYGDWSVFCITSEGNVNE